jgi:hypothetical protein
MEWYELAGTFILGGGALYATGRLLRHALYKVDERLARRELDAILNPKPEDMIIVETLSQLEANVREEMDRIKEIAPTSSKCKDLNYILTTFKVIDYKNRKVDKILLRGIHHMCDKYAIDFPDPEKIKQKIQQDINTTPKQLPTDE